MPVPNVVMEFEEAARALMKAFPEKPGSDIPSEVHLAWVYAGAFLRRRRKECGSLPSSKTSRKKT